jgi:methyl-accepting chemotaxis protein
MDDFGELAELINRLLDEFARVVSGIAAEAARTRNGADAIASVVARAEAEAAQSRRLREALDGLRGAAANVNEAAEIQDRSAADSSAAMEEMAASIQAVEALGNEVGRFKA